MTQPPEVPGSNAGTQFELRWALEQMVQRNASDLHLKVGRPAILRIDGELVVLNHPPLTADDVNRTAEQILTPEFQQTFNSRHEVDFAMGVPGLGRFRINLFRQRGSTGFAIRAIPFDIPSFAELHLPLVLEDVARYPRGLVLVTGITGSGKSTTLASIIRRINETRAVNVVTIEDPIEFLHRDQKSIVSQREVGPDTRSFHDALRHVLRQDPDVIMLGEIRDQVTMDTALKAANTGHLVFSTLHTTDASQTIARIITFFPPHEQAEVRTLLSDALRAVISMRLVPRADGAGRVPALEIMINTAAIQERIRTGEQLEQLPELIAEGGQQYGMQSFDQSLLELMQSGTISYETAVYHSTTPADFKLKVSGVAGASDLSWTPGLGG